MNRRAFLALLAGAPLLARAASAPVAFVVHPYDTPSRLYARFRPLTLYLGGLLGRPMRLIIAATYDEQIEMIASGRADYAYLGPTPYVRARARAKVEILAGETEAGQAFYQSALVVRSDSQVCDGITAAALGNNAHITPVSIGELDNVVVSLCRTDGL